jgi:nitrous oxidase accessory protein NosD
MFFRSIIISGVAAASTSAVAQDRSFVPYGEVSITGGSESINGSLGLLVPFAIGDASVLFGDLNARLANGGVLAGSLGFGLRSLMENGWTLGGYAYYDYFESERENTFHQLGFGIEALSQDLELRANVYAPVGGNRAREDSESEIAVEDGRLVFRQGYEQALAGVDAEVGYRLPIFRADDPAQLRVYGGAYYYDGAGIDALPGVSARAEFTVTSLPGVTAGSSLTLGAEVSYDRETELAGAIVARLRVPLGGGGARPADDPLIRRVERASTIRTEVGAFGEREAAVYADTGEEVGRVLILAGEDADEINALLAESGRNALIFATGDFAVDDTVRLADGQRLLGGGSAVTVGGIESGGRLAYGNTGGRASFYGSDSAAAVFAMASRSMLASLDITGGRDGILIDGADGVRVSDVSIAGAARDGVHISGSSDVTLSRLTIDGAAAARSLARAAASGNGIYAENTSGLAGRVLDITGVNGDGIHLSGSSDVDLAHVVIRGGTHGVFGADIATASFGNFDIAEVAGDGIHLETATDVSIASTRIAGTDFSGRDGISALDTTDLTIRDTEISGVGSDGIRLVSSSGIAIEDVTIRDLYICEGNSPDTGIPCEYSIFDPAHVQYAAVNAVGVSDLAIRQSRFENVTYGLFASSSFAEVDWETVVDEAATDIAVEGLDVISSRREGMLLVSANGVAIDDLTIDNGALGRDMDLAVFMRTSGVTLANSRFIGGVNGLMFASAYGLPGTTSDITVSNVTIEGPSRTGIFLNPSSDIRFENVTITDAGTHGIYFYGDSYGFLGGPVRNIGLSGVSIDGTGDAAVYISGPIEGIDGTVSIANAATLCASDASPWSGTSITQPGGEVFRLNSTVVDGATLPVVCP